MTKRLGVFLAAAFAACATLLAATGNDSVTLQFEKLKSLAGDWTKVEGDGSVVASYHVTAAGSAVVETLFPGTGHEMMTMFTVDHGGLVLTHYCAEGNQPHMKALKGSDAAALDFKFDGGGNMASDKDGHMHEATFTFVDANHLTTTWQYYKDGKPGEKVTLVLVRKTS